MKWSYTAWRQVTPEELFELTKVARYHCFPELEFLEMLIGEVYGVTFKVFWDEEDRFYVVLDATSESTLRVMISIVEEVLKRAEEKEG